MTEVKEEIAKPVIESNEQSKEPKAISLCEMYKYLTRQQKALAVLASLMSLTQGCAMPMSAILMGKITTSFTPDKSIDEIRNQGIFTSVLMLLLAIATFILAGGGIGIWKYIGVSLAAEMRKRYFSRILEQDQEWYDISHPEKLTAQLSDDVSSLKRGSGQALHKVLFASSLAISGLAVGFGYGWFFALIILLTIPFSFIGIFCYLMVNSKAATVESKNYEKAASISNEAIENISTVLSLNGQDHEQDLFMKEMINTMKAGIKFNCIAALFFGLFMFMLSSVYGFGFWVGAQIIKGRVYNINAGRDYQASDIMTIFFCVISGCMSLGAIGPNLFSVTKGKLAAARMIEVINMPIKIDYRDTSKKSVDKLSGDIEFKDVHFCYPSRPEVKILKGVSFVAKAGQKIAFVGGTGCGKSTAIQLIERYYDANQGTVLIDGIPIKDYNLSSLRSKIGYVGQEPRLFAMTIKENLLIGKPTATDEEIKAALKLANATAFIHDLEDGINTYVGPGGSQLSGGQKQRIAIARTALQNPCILLLDESTSALDSKNEREIQAALDEFSQNRTTITIAHRLTTIMNSDCIIVMKSGNIAEFGTHEELLKQNGVYKALVDEQFSNNTNTMGVGLTSVIRPVTPNDPDIIEVKNIDEDGQPKETSQTNKVLKKKNSSVTPAPLEVETSKVEYGYPKPMPFLLRYLSGSYIYVFLAIFASLITGCIFPAIGNLLAKTTNILIKYDLMNNGIPIKDYERSDADKEILNVGLYFVIVGATSFIANYFEVACFGVLGERITMKVRNDLYKALLSKDLDFFYMKNHSSGHLASILSKDCSVVNAIVSKSYGAIVKGLASMICGLVIAFIASWKLSLVAIIACPLLIASSLIINASEKSMNGPEEEGEDNILVKKDLKLFQEAVNNSKTVAALCCQDEFLRLYNNEIQIDKESANSKGCKDGIWRGFGESGIFFVFSMVFLYGTFLIYNNEITVGEFFEAYLGITFAAIGAASSQEFIPDMNAANESATEIIKLLYYPNQIKSGDKKPEIKGHIVFENVTFTYPSRKQAVFKNLSLEILPGDTVGFAGPSGQGKSTIFRLLYRLYDPQEGRILLDGIDIKEYELEHLRGVFGMVNQEPSLFNNSVMYNIK